MSRHQPGDVLDHYELLEVLGTGAYAEAYKARDIETGELVVLKSPEPGLFADPGLFQRYRREMQISRTLNHPNVQCSVDIGETRTEPYLVLEYVEGSNLRQAIRAREHKVSVELAIDWGKQIAAALAYLHEHGIVHRDLKPENILISTEGDLKVTDFGTAMMDGAKRLTWRHLTDSLGTPDYMSPEQIQGDRGDARSDIYAWGILMYELLTGQVPFHGDNWMAVMAGHMQGTPKPISSQRPDCPPALEAIVLHAMRRMPENRYQSVDDLLADLNHLDTLDLKSFDSSPEPAIGGIAAADSEARLWLYIVLIAVGFLGLCAVIITLSVVLR
ncbi:MAG TPA: serine/threonine-protein kinase [Acidimicrobiales bacterium]|nr:serine/threonine-protein kinase [Acidimicrobiales bacterium]